MSIRKRIGKSRKVSYQVRIKLSSGKWESKTFNRKADAVTYEQDFLLKMKKGELSVASFAAKKMNVQEFWDEWAISNRYKVSEGWQSSQNQMYRDYIKPIIGEYKLNTITPADISNILSKARALGRSPQTLLHIYNLLNKILGDACHEYEYITRVPVKKSQRPTIPQKESNFLELDDLINLLKITRSKRYGLAVWLQSYCGLRVGEVQALRWDNVDLKNEIIHIRSTYCRKTKTFQDYPKGRKWSTIKIPPELLDYLIELKPALPIGLVIKTPCSSLLTYKTYSDALKRYSKEAGITINLTTHILRHSTPQIYLAHGANRDDLQALFSHSSGEVTERYIHDQRFREKSIHQIASEIKILN